MIMFYMYIYVYITNIDEDEDEIEEPGYTTLFIRYPRYGTIGEMLIHEVSTFYEYGVGV